MSTPLPSLSRIHQLFLSPIYILLTFQGLIVNRQYILMLFGD
jgi:hypothetical protein